MALVADIKSLEWTSTTSNRLEISFWMNSFLFSTENRQTFVFVYMATHARHTGIV